MLAISKEEAKYLRNNFPTKVKSSHSRNKHYYCVEDFNVLKALNKYRESKLVK